MAGYFNARAERERRQRDNNPARILELARIKGGFSVSLRWRDDSLRALCFRMKKQGLLVGGRRNGDAVIFYAAVGATANDYQRRPSKITAAQQVRHD